jgi:MFS family permease
MFARIQKIYYEFPGKFWVVVATSFIDEVGATILFPFFALYITQKFNVGMTVAGLMLAINSAAGLTGSTIGGAITDKFGRRGIIIFGLVLSSMSSIALGLTSNINLFYGVIVFSGLFGRVASPAHSAMIADILPEHQRAEGFGILRVGGNLAWLIGPTIGGFMASRSYLSLFVMDAGVSLITAVIFYRLIPETKPQPREATERQSLLQVLRGYRLVLRDRLFVVFIVATILVLTVYQQMYSTLSVYLRDEHGISPQEFGLLMSICAGLVVLTQFPLTRYVKRFPMLLMMAVATGFYLVGFTMIGLVSTYAFFVLALLIITVGEMIEVPTYQSLMAAFAPEDMRGRYMAFGGLCWAVPAMVGPWAAGLILDRYNPDWVWYICGILCAIAIFVFYILQLRLGGREQFKPQSDASAG